MPSTRPPFRPGRRSRLGSTALPLALALGVAGGLQALELPAATPLRAARAQTNPCAPAARPANPCAPAARPANPCAPAARPANPCAPAAANPCAAASPAANPCAPAAANPCAARPAVAGAAATPFDTALELPQAPYGDAMPAIVKNYLRAAPYVGTGGVVEPGAFAQLAQLGFKTVVNLNTAEEGAAAEGEAARAAGLAYVSIPVASEAPTQDEVAAFTRVANDAANYPILLHCQSSNRVGALWALYRAANGVPAGIAVQEGRTVGLKPSREGAVRDILGLPALGG